MDLRLSRLNIVGFTRRDAEYNMAVDRYLLDLGEAAAEAAATMPDAAGAAQEGCLRFYDWIRPTISLGHSEPLENIDSENALKKRCFASREVSDVRAFAEKLVGKFKTRYTDGGTEVETEEFSPSKLSDADIDAAMEELEDVMRELRAAREAAKIAAKQAADDTEAENEAVRAFVAEGLGEAAA